MRDKCIHCKYCDNDVSGFVSIEYCRYPNFGQSLNVDGTAYLHELSDGYCPMERKDIWNNAV